MGVIKSKMGSVGSKMGRKFEQKRKANWVGKKSKFGQGLISQQVIALKILADSLGKKEKSLCY